MAASIDTYRRESDFIEILFWDCESAANIQRHLVNAIRKTAPDVNAAMRLYVRVIKNSNSDSLTVSCSKYTSGREKPGRGSFGAVD